MNLGWLTFFGGICILIYGLNVVRENLQKISGDYLRHFLSKIGKNKFIAFLTGFFMTLVLQSSSATIALVVGFTSSAVLTLPQAMAIILGADVGTTITVQLLATHISDYALLFVIIGFILIHILSWEHQAYGQLILGIGLAFLGMLLMQTVGKEFQRSEELPLIIELLKKHPFISLFMSILATAVLQSSAASLGIILSLAYSQTLLLSEALPMIIGANIGGCIFPLLISLKTKERGKQAALAHVLLKVSGAVLILPFLPFFENLVLSTSDLPTRQIANAHFLFNGILALLFLPFTKVGALFIQKLIPTKPEPEIFRSKYLDQQALSTPSFALGQASREIIRMAEIVQEMLEKTIVVFKKNDVHILSQIEKLETKSDILYHEIKRYLVQLPQQMLSSEQADQLSELVILTCDLENIGDTIVKNILHLAKTKIQKRLHFSEEGLKELVEFHKQATDHFQLTISAFTNQDLDLYRKVLQNRETLLTLELQLRETHLVRLRHGIKEALDTSSVHIELLSYLGRINALISNIAFQTLQKNGVSNGTSVTDKTLH